MKKAILIFLVFLTVNLFAQETRLLRQPSLSDTHLAFAYAGDIWITNLQTKQSIRLTSTGAVEKDPQISPDGKTVAFASNRTGYYSVYTVPVGGGEPKRLTWHPSSVNVRGWTPDGKQILYSSTRETAPGNYGRLWLVPATGGPSEIISKQWGFDGSLSPDGKKIVVDRISRWDVEWRGYRGGQNTPLIILNLDDQFEELISNEKQTDTQPLWLGDKIYFLSDRDWTANIWAYSIKTKELSQVTSFKGSDIKSFSGKDNKLVYERDGYLYEYDLNTGKSKKFEIYLTGDFPWAETHWEDVTDAVNSATLSPTGKRVIMEARGEVFTIPVEFGNTRNLTNSSNAADRSPLWSPKGDQLAWFSDKDEKGYALYLTKQDGLSESRKISIGESKMAWEPVWSPDGKYIAFADDDVRIRIIDIEGGTVKTADTGGTNIERGSMGLTWSPDSKWLAYSKTGPNNFRQITLWSVVNNSTHKITNSFADAFSPAWDFDKKHLYFLAGTDLALGSGWANTSVITADPKYEAYVINLQKNEPSPFCLRSDEEPAAKNDTVKTSSTQKDYPKGTDSKDKNEVKKDSIKNESVIIDLEGIELRTFALPMPKRNYSVAITGSTGTVFIGEEKPNTSGMTLHKFTLEKRESAEFASEVRNVTISADGKKMLAKTGSTWKVINTSGASGKDGDNLKVSLKMKLDRTQEWRQIFEEAWRYERDYFYDPELHGRNWDEVYKRYSPLIPYVKHREDLHYILDQVNGELSVGHSFVFGGDFPKTDNQPVGLLGADLKAENNRWKIQRIFSTESWNSELSSPLAEPGLKVKTGDYIVGVNGKELTSNEDPFQYLEGTSGIQTVLHINSIPDFKDSWTITVKPIGSENALRQRAWVEDNRRIVDSLSGGKLAYVWVPNTSSQGLVSFNRYYFAQQDKLGAVIDERFNGGGLLDDYMVDLMVRRLRASLTNEVPDGIPSRLPAGILGPKVLIINEMAGSGGDFFPWVFRQQKVGPLIGVTTWGGLVKSSVHYSLVDGGALTAPDNAVFDPVNKKWIAENEGVAPDITVRQDARSLSEGRDPQLERAVKEVLLLIEKEGTINVIPPPFPKPAKN